MPNRSRKQTLGRINGLPVHGPLPAPRRNVARQPKARPRRPVAFLRPSPIPFMPPVSFANRTLNRGPRMLSRGNICTVAHKELVTTLTNTNGLFQAFGFPINPGLSSMFPWLSNIAGNFEKYKFSKLLFTYRPFVSTTIQGQVIAAIDLDVLDQIPTDLQSMWNFMNRQDSPVWSTMTISTPEYQPELYVRTSGPPTGTDQKTYDCGQLILATNNTVANQACGVVEVDYVVHLHTPQVSSGSAAASLTIVNNVVTSNATGLFGIPGSVPEISGNLAKDVILNAATVNRFQFPAIVGRPFLVTVDIRGTGITGSILVNAPSVSGSTGFLGAPSSTFTATGATYVNIITCTGLTNVGSTRGQFFVDITCPGASAIGVAAATLTVSPWQFGLVFP